MLEPTQDRRPDCARLSGRRIFVPSIAILALVAAALFLCAGFGESSDLETKSPKGITLVRADDSAVHLIETRDGAVVAETPSTGNDKLERAVGI